MAVTADPRIGSVLAGYRVEALLGRGGMGVVYLTQDLSLERKVALKLLAPELSSDDDFRERFLRESRLAASIDHPNVIPIYEAGEADGTLFIAMRYVEGTDLKQLLEQEQPLEPARTIALLAQVAEALDVAHEHGLVHRDVKPANILIAAQGGREHVYLADFGLSRRLAAPGALERSHFAGTVDYAAPEQIRREPVDGRTDLYALACVLHECLTGQPPFRRDSPHAALFAHLEDDPPPASAANPELPAAIDPVLTRALAKEPAERQPTCGALIDEARGDLGVAPRPGWRHLPRRIKLSLLFLLAAVAAAAAIPTLLLTGRTPEEALPQITDTSLVQFDPDTGDAIAVLDVNGSATSLAAYDGVVWLADPTHGTILRVDEATATITATTAIDGTPTDVAASEGAIWIVGTDRGSGIVTRLDPATGLVRGEPVALPLADPVAVAAGADAVWVAANDLASGSALLRLDPSTGAVVSSTPSEGRLGDVTVSRHGVWTLAARPDGTDFVAAVTRFDPATGQALVTVTVSSINSQSLTELAADDAGVWTLSGRNRESVVHVDGATGDVDSPIPHGLMGPHVAAGIGSVWLAGDDGCDGNGVHRIDRVTGQIVSRLGPTGQTFVDVIVSAHGVWAAAGPDGCN